MVLLTSSIFDTVLNVFLWECLYEHLKAGQKKISLSSKKVFPRPLN